jgi:Putative GTPase activating protein for Arf
VPPADRAAANAAVAAGAAVAAAAATRCCDCDAELTDLRNIYASVRVGCFVCVNCKQVHERLEPAQPCKSVFMDHWTVSAQCTV